MGFSSQQVEAEASPKGQMCRGQRGGWSQAGREGDSKEELTCSAGLQTPKECAAAQESAPAPSFLGFPFKIHAPAVPSNSDTTDHSAGGPGRGRHDPGSSTH